MPVLQTLKGSVNVAENGGEYGRMKIRTNQDSKLFSYETDHTQTVWMSHGDEVVKLPEGFKAVATSEQVGQLSMHSTYQLKACIRWASRCQLVLPFLLLLLEKQSSLPRLRHADPLSHFFAQCRRTRGIPHRLRAIMHHDAHLRIMCKPIWGDLQSTVLAQGAIVAVECPAKLIYGLQYHPEVMHSDRGTPTLRHFLLQIAGMQPDWKIENILEEEMEKIRRTVCLDSCQHHLAPEASSQLALAQIAAHETMLAPYRTVLDVR